MAVGQGWLPDPMGRHEFRWWDGSSWSDIVADQGVETVDRMDAQHAAAVGVQPQPRPPLEPAGSVPPSAERRSNRQLALVTAVAAVAVVVVGVVAVVVNGGGDDEADGTTAAPTTTATDPRDAVVVAADMPAGWEEAEQFTAAPSENLMCEPRLEPPNPPRKTEVGFNRSDPTGALLHQIGEYSPGFAADLLDESERQAGQCGTYQDEDNVQGQTLRTTVTPEILTGPTLGDETLWYVLHVEGDTPEANDHDVLVCLDRHEGVVSAFTLSTPPPTSDADRTLVEDLARTVSDRLQS